MNKDGTFNVLQHLIKTKLVLKNRVNLEIFLCLLVIDLLVFKMIKRAN
jgi:hypothetical protein